MASNLPDDILAGFSRLSLGSSSNPITIQDKIGAKPAQPYATEDREQVFKSILEDLADTFCERWGISYQAADNFVSLTLGRLTLPVIVVQNPANNHDWADFDGMVEYSPTLSWIEKKLHENGLSIDDIIILDVCPLISKQWVKSHPDEAPQAVSEAFRLFERIVDFIKPRKVLSCQCATRNRPWSDKDVLRNLLYSEALPIAQQMGSSVHHAMDGLTVTVSLSGYSISVVQGFHPMYFLYMEDEDAACTFETVLEYRFSDVFRTESAS
jgi:hypothetical protein